MPELSAKSNSPNVKSMFDLKTNRNNQKLLQLAVDQISAKDRKLASVITRVGPCRILQKSTDSAFEALVQSIVSQQLSGQAAQSIFNRVKLLSGNARLPEPQFFVDAEDDVLRYAGLSRAKALSIRDLAQKMIDGQIPSIEEMIEMPEEEILRRLTAVRGIGRWTVEMLLMFRLGKLDVLPSTDLGVRKGFALTYGKKELPEPAHLEKFGERWRPYRSVASWYLWRALEF